MLQTKKGSVMAIAATPIIRSRDFLDLLKQMVPPQEKAVEVYRRLLAINELSSSMNAARDIDKLQQLLKAYFLEYLPEENIRLCVLEGAAYRKERLSGPEVSACKEIVSLDNGIAGSVLRSGVPLWIADTNPMHRIRRFSEA